jgi:sporulation protein YlmC with PRC-barrel domain
MIRQSNLAGLVGAKVVDRDGDKIGTVGRIYVDPSTGHANWAAVRTGLFGTSETFLPLQEADEDGDTIRVPYEKSFVKDAPRIEDDTELTHDEEDELYAYYDSLLPGAGGAEESVGPASATVPAGTTAPAGTAAPAAPAGSSESDVAARPRLRKHVQTDDTVDAASRGSVRVDPGTDASTRA